MSRTYKDKPTKLLCNWRQDVIPCEGYGYRLGKTTKPKKRKEVDTEDHWMSTPGWWVSLTMNKPQRKAGRNWESKFTNSYIDVEYIEQTDAPGVSRKPHVYYW